MPTNLTALRASVHMPLSSSYLCQDCASVHNCPTQCPACASAAIIALATVLNRNAAQPGLDRVEEEVCKS
jgi:hypothetical protein